MEPFFYECVPVLDVLGVFVSLYSNSFVKPRGYTTCFGENVNGHYLQENHTVHLNVHKPNWFSVTNLVTVLV